MMMKVENKGSLENNAMVRQGFGKRKRRSLGIKRNGGMRERVTSAGVSGTFNDSRTEEDVNSAQSTIQTCGGRVLRSRRYRRPFEDKPIKRLFTPEIKRFLKGWLVRRRENPYPSREEKKELSRQTALTYVQICNWFANWRRKLKNAAEEANLYDTKSHDSSHERDSSGREDEKMSRSSGGGRRKGRTWGNLIRRYNSRAQGNVEQFSITSDDSIWEEPEENVDVEEEDEEEEEDGEEMNGAGEVSEGSEDDTRGSEEDWATMEHSYSILLDRPKCRHRFPTPPTEDADRMERKARMGGKSFRVRSSFTPGCRKGSYDATSTEEESSDEEGEDFDVIMEDKKKLACSGKGSGARGRDKCIGKSDTKCSVVSKWLESACAFDERKRNYSSVEGAGGTPVRVKWAARNVTWSTADNKMDDNAPWVLSRLGVDTSQSNSCQWSVAGRHREELDAAETLTLLAATSLP